MLCHWLSLVLTSSLGDDDSLQNSGNDSFLVVGSTQFCQTKKQRSRSQAGPHLKHTSFSDTHRADPLSSAGQPFSSPPNIALPWPLSLFFFVFYIAVRMIRFLTLNAVLFYCYRHSCVCVYLLIRFSAYKYFTLYLFVLYLFIFCHFHLGFDGEEKVGVIVWLLGLFVVGRDIYVYTQRERERERERERDCFKEGKGCCESPLVCPVVFLSFWLFVWAFKSETLQDSQLRGFLLFLPDLATLKHLSNCHTGFFMALPHSAATKKENRQGMAEACEASSSFPGRHYDFDGVGNMPISAESNCELVSTTVYRQGSALDRLEAIVQMSDGAVSAHPTSLKSDISTEISLPLSNGSIEMDARKRCLLNAAEDGLNEQVPDRQRTESSCSESLSVPLPVLLTNRGHCKTSKETCCGGGSIDSSSKGFGCGLEEAVTASSESGSSAQVACQAVKNGRSCCHDGVKMMTLDISGESKDILSISSKPAKSELHGKADQDALVVAGFDLNKDINENGMDVCVQSFVESVSSQHVIQVVAKAGQLSGQPKIPLQFEGMLGWKGTAQTSAFHSISLAKSSGKRTCSRDSKGKDEPGFIGIDLNAAAAAEEDVPCSEQSQGHPWIDLNCLCDDADEFIHPLMPLVSEKLPSVDLKLNRLASAGDTSKIAADFLSPRKHNSNCVGSVQHVASNSDIPVAAATNILQPVELMQRVTSLQHSSRDLNNFCSRGPIPTAVPFPGTIRYAPYPHDHAIYPALLNPGTVHPAFYTPHLVQIVHEPNSGNAASSSIPRVFITDGSIAAYGIQTDEVRRLHQVPGYFTSMKRKEPEGGFRGYQLGTTRQTNGF